MAKVVKLADRLKQVGNEHGWVEDGPSGRVRHLALTRPLPLFDNVGYTALIKPLCLGRSRPMHPATARSPLPWCKACVPDATAAP